MTKTPVLLHATFTATPGNAQAVANLLRDFADCVRQEPGNTVFEATQHADDPHRFFVYEEYIDEASFQQHLRAPYGRPFNEALSSLIVEPSSRLTLLHRLSVPNPRKSD